MNIDDSVAIVVISLLLMLTVNVAYHSGDDDV